MMEIFEIAVDFVVVVDDEGCFDFSGSFEEMIRKRNANEDDDGD